MNTLSVMGIIGIVIAALSFLCIYSFEYSDIDAAFGWGIIAAAYL